MQTVQWGKKHFCYLFGSASADSELGESTQGTQRFTTEAISANPLKVVKISKLGCAVLFSWMGHQSNTMSP